MKQLLYDVLNRYSSLFRSILGIFLMVLLGNGEVKAQDELNVIRNNWLHYGDAPNSLYRNLSGQAFVLLARRAEKIAKLRSLSDWQQREKWVRKTLLDIVGPFPEKTPLNATITRVVYNNGFRVEHIVYESQPEFYVTSSLFIPDKLKGKAPTIIYCSGHAGNGYRDSIYQHVILNLVKKGFIVFAFDPIGQGERVEYYDQNTNKSSIGGPTDEHSYPGVQAFITGGSLARYMIWDGVRAVDYLLTRNEVDSTRIGITGRSGGGTQSAYIAAFDGRIKASAPENYITNFTRLLQSIGPQDAEQNLFNEIARGIDHADLLEIRAPKPTLMITTTRDMFSIQGSIETANEVSRIYKDCRKQDNFRMVTDDAPHESTKKNREAMYAFFQKNLDNKGDSTDEELNILSEKDLQVTQTGQVSTSRGGETVFSLNRKAVLELENKVQVSRRNFPGVIKLAKKLSGYHEPLVYHEPVFTGRFQRNGYVIEKYFIKGEEDYVIPYLLMKPEHSNRKALIYLNPSGKSAEASSGGEMEWFVKNGFTVLAPDLLGIGEMGPGKLRGDNYIKGFSYNTWFLSMLIGRSIVGIQTGDVVRLTNLLKKSQGIDEVYGLARNEMAPVLLYAAAFDTMITHIALIEPYSSYRSMVMDRLYKPSFMLSTVPGALGAYDLPDLAASLAPRKLMMAGVTDGAGNSIKNESVNKDLDIIKATYNDRKASRQLNIKYGEQFVKPYDLFAEWIK